MTRRLSLLAGWLGLGAAALGVTLLAVAPAAHATDVTNPAQHPAPVTVTIDGQTYHDGLDTLPGYDDYACTAIPDVQYDFADNEIYYYDDQGNLLASAHWTEWSRISSYQTWLKQQKAASASPKPAGSSSSHAPSTHQEATSSPKKKSDPTSRRTGNAASSASAAARDVTAGSASSAGPGSSTSSATPANGAGSSNDAAAPNGGADPSPAPTGATTAGAQGADQPPVALAAQTLGAAVTSGLGRGAGDTRLAGAGILAALAVAGLGLLLVSVVRRQAFGRRGTGPGIKGAHS